MDRNMKEPFDAPDICAEYDIYISVNDGSFGAI